MAAGRHKKISAAISILFFILSLSLVNCAGAQTEGFVAAIESPVAGQTINGDRVNLHFSVTNNQSLSTMQGDHFWAQSISYSVYLDGVLNQNRETSSKKWANTFEADFAIANLAQGEHTVRVDVCLVMYVSVLFVPVPVNLTASADFLVYRGIEPQVSIGGSDASKTGQATFNIETTATRATISYSLDEAANVTLQEKMSNVTLTGLANGAHTLTVYAKDAFNQTATAQKAFTIDQPMSTQTIVLIVGGAIAVGILGCGVTFWRRNKKDNADGKTRLVSQAVM
jgi:hypothetical protein